MSFRRVHNQLMGEMEEAGLNPASTFTCDYYIEVHDLGAVIGGEERNAVLAANLCPNCPDVHVTLSAPGMLLRWTMSPKEAEKLGYALVSPPVPKGT